MSRKNRKKARRQAARRTRKAAKRTIQRIRNTAPAKRTSGQTRRLEAAKQARTTANRRLENNRNRQTTVPSTQRRPDAESRVHDRGAKNTNIRKQNFGNKLNVSEVRNLMNQGASSSRIKNIAEKRNISIGGKAQSLINRSSKNNVPQIGSNKFQNASLRKQAEMVKGNQELKSSKEGRSKLKQARGQMTEDGYDYGLRFGQGDIRRLEASGMDQSEIASYIDQNDINNKVSRRYLASFKGPGPNEFGQTPTPTPAPSTDPSESGDPVNTTPIDTEVSDTGQPDQEIETTVPTLDNFNLDEISNYLSDRGFSITENATPEPTPAPQDPVATEESNFPTFNPFFGMMGPTQNPVYETKPSPTSTTPTPTVTPPKESVFDSVSNLTAGNNLSEVTDTLAKANETFFKDTTDKPYVSPVRPSNQMYIPEMGSFEPPYVQPKNPFTDQPYTLDADGFPSYPNMTYSPNSTIPGQVTPSGTVAGLYQPNPPQLPNLSYSGPYDPRIQYSEDGMGYLPGQPVGTKYKKPIPQAYA